MPFVESLQVTSPESLATIALSQDQLTQAGLGCDINSHLNAVSGNEQDSTARIQLNLDLGQVERISSAGLNELIGINSAARSRGIRLVLLDVQESVREVFVLTRLERMFEFASSGVGS